MMYRILYIIVCIWQFPQILFGFILARFYTRHIGPAGFKFVNLRSSWIPGFSLGEYLFIGNPRLTRFMYGRGVLSRIFGPLFFPIITLPTFLVGLTGSEFYFFQLYATRWSMKLGKKK